MDLCISLAIFLSLVIIWKWRTLVQSRLTFLVVYGKFCCYIRKHLRIQIQKVTWWWTPSLHLPRHQPLLARCVISPFQRFSSYLCLCWMPYRSGKDFTLSLYAALLVLILLLPLCYSVVHLLLVPLSVTLLYFTLLWLSIPLLSTLVVYLLLALLSVTT